MSVVVVVVVAAATAAVDITVVVTVAAAVVVVAAAAVVVVLNPACSLCSVGAIMAEKLQDLGNTYHQLFFQTYWIHSSYAVLYIIWKIWL